MLREISWRKFLRWYAYEQLEPFGERRADYRAASIVTMLANVNRDPKKGRPFKIDDFVLSFDAPVSVTKRQQSLEFQKKVLEAIALAYTAPNARDDT